MSMKEMKMMNEMRKTSKKALAALAMMLAVVNAALAGTPETTESLDANSAKQHRILVVGIKDNVKSNYFDVDILSEDSKIAADSICYIYNKVIGQNLSAIARKEKSPYMFVSSEGLKDECSSLLQQVSLTGEEDKISADLASVSGDQLKQLLDKAGAAYLLVLDAHYLRYQEVPFKTIFHYVNYSLYDAEKQRLAEGSNYFTSINPQTEAQMLKSSRKSTAKMVDLVEHTLKN